MAANCQLQAKLKDCFKLSEAARSGRPDFCELAAQVMETKQLQKEAAQRLNVMVDELRNSQNADLSAKNLGEEGCIYISEGLAFNDR